MRTIKFVLITMITFFGLVYLLIMSYIYFHQREIIFDASKLSKDYKFEFAGNFEELNIPSFDNLKLNGLLFKVKNSKGLIFYLHGNSGALDSWGNVATVYNNLGYDIFILDYRGYGKSEGVIENEEQFYKDILFSYKKLISKYKEEQTIIIGYSIGTGPAAYLASVTKPKCLVLQAPYFNFIEYSGARVPFMPVFLKKFKFPTNKFVEKIKSPIFIFHGNKDNVIPVSNSKKLSKILKPMDHFYVLENQDHIGINENEQYLLELEKLLKK
ncbi:hypothetical protein CLU83_0059 [Flavobacterium sp. 1]|uniref:alpha/beta hydrolase n=1 Tax=Flavobacterium sp. 1 TaxID=2035200 RepID=UPI000CC1F49D|nr:alpha/beta fold hydrolase [Flavobacterium sp. 1]PJJ06939.1 hypothetical protein CLU83_0059 [Flavobacterium sp. 1]